jgi:hypothetical protein
MKKLLSVLDESFITDYVIGLTKLNKKLFVKNFVKFTTYNNNTCYVDYDAENKNYVCSYNHCDIVNRFDTLHLLKRYISNHYIK